MQIFQLKKRVSFMGPSTIISFKHPKEARLVAVGLIRNATENGTESETEEKKRKKRGTCKKFTIIPINS